MEFPPWRGVIEQSLAGRGGSGYVLLNKLVNSMLWLISNKILLHSAVIEHTNRVIYMEDDDVAAVVNGSKWSVCNFVLWLCTHQ